MAVALQHDFQRVRDAARTPMLHCKSFHELTVSPVQCAVYAPDPKKVDLHTRKLELAS